MGREFELKFSATPEQQSAVAEKYPPTRQIAMETTYYDTRDGALEKARITLRRRMENGVSVCTVKTPAADGARGEWELQWQDPDTMVAELCKLGAPETLLSLTAEGIAPICGAKFTRRAAILPVPGGEVELALDEGILIGGGKELSLREIEVELKAGPDSAARDFGERLAREFALTPEHKSKFRRALSLAREAEHG